MTYFDDRSLHKLSWIS